MNKSVLKDISLFFLIYFISSIFLILNFDAVYWDDWCMYNQTIETRLSLFRDFNNDAFYYLNKFLYNIGNGLYIYRIFVFFAYFVSGVFIYFILKKIRELNYIDVLYITIFFLLMPVISSRVSISIIPFFLPMLIFFAVFFVLTKYLENNIFILRPIILIGFFISFYTNSILVFYAIVLIYIFYIKYNFEINMSNIKSFIYKYIDFIVLPIIFFIIKSIYFKSTGLYDGYNALGSHSILKIFLKFIKSFDSSIFDVLHSSFFVALEFWPLIFIIVFLTLKKVSNNLVAYEINVNSYKFFIFGFILFILAVFPYIAVSKLPVVDSLESRFQLLTPLGLAFIFYFGINIIVKYFNLSNKIKLVLLVVMIFSFIAKNINDYYKFEIDNLYMTSVMINIQDNDKIKDNSTFIVNNNIGRSLMYERNLRFYEWNGIMKKAFGEDSRLMTTYQQYKKFNYLQKHKQYNFSKWMPSKPLIVNIDYNDREIFKAIDLFKIYVLKFRDYKEYLKESKKLTLVSTQTFNEVYGVLNNVQK